ncbi:D-alanyl-D-alanine carboxypeptidase family protein [Eubacterium oxidoreducens]|uniref:D-alanyl-D-alanine carboxypeptidase (Penicillin-binding protein 5/6) n=1 Tax=Eubacterium oxidoreducens TaxID=1732 RepID=A0A1G6ALL8_EUBOX|nr:serine hydrolase [Eubacterium oxidoreducens]SDB09251.1 D-alanyl-D-alanine carboxypeptidase (penicillin-binding protein 5/6) [Eubacterium oxidoreducens]
MKCINKTKSIIISIVICTLLFAVNGCSFQKEIELEDAYDTLVTSAQYGLVNSDSYSCVDYFASDLCVIGMEDYGIDQIENTMDTSAGFFDINAKNVSYAENLFDKMYPASTTKIMTAYVAIKYGNLSDEVTVSEEALSSLPSDSSNAGLAIGDTLTLEQLIYGLMLCSGNDAANVIAEHISGSVSEFAKLMNKEALAAGATGTNFVNANGLHDDDHYTTAYDLYLIFNKALENEDFYKVISTKEYSASYQNSSGETVTKEWSSTNWYKNGTTQAPTGITVIGGKTGTTNEAGSCLVLLSEKDEATPYISIVLHANSHADLYQYMNEILTEFSN